MERNFIRLVSITPLTWKLDEIGYSKLYLRYRTFWWAAVNRWWSTVLPSVPHLSGVPESWILWSTISLKVPFIKDLLCCFFTSKYPSVETMEEVLVGSLARKYISCFPKTIPVSSRIYNIYLLQQTILCLIMIDDSSLEILKKKIIQRSSIF